MPKVLNRSAGWCWFADPRALYHDDHIYVGYIDRDSRVWVAQILDDPEQSYPMLRYKISDATTVGTPADDHASPTLLIRQAGDPRVVVFWSGHSGPAMNYRISTNPADIRSFGSVLQAKVPSGSYGNTYPNPWELNDGKVYLTYRGAATFQPTITRTDSLGNPGHWETPKHMIQATAGQRPYLKAVAAPGGSTLHLVFTDGHPRNVQTSLYHAKLQNGTFRRSDGTTITTWTSLPFNVTQATKIFDGPANACRVWLWDVAIGEDTDWEPRVLFSVLPNHGAGPDARINHQYWTARWTGSTWQTEFVADAGGSISADSNGTTTEDHYSAGGCLDPDHPDQRMWLSIPRDGVHDIAEFKPYTHGCDWSAVGWVAKASPEPRIRPVAVRGHPTGKLLWLEGPYGEFADFGTRLVLGDPVTPPA